MVPSCKSDIEPICCTIASQCCPPMAVGLRHFLDGLRTLGEEPDYEPEIDDKDKEKDKSLRFAQSGL